MTGYGSSFPEKTHLMVICDATGRAPTSLYDYFGKTKRRSSFTLSRPDNGALAKT